MHRLPPRATVSPLILALCAALCLRSHAAGAQHWTEGFEGGLGTTKPYHSKAPQATLEVTAAAPAEGKQFVRATLPGKSALEGLNVTARGLEGGRVATVTAQVRGTGDLWLCLISANGWLYSPNTVALTPQWQEVSLSKALMVRDKGLGIHFITKIQQGAVFEVDDIRVTLAEPPKTYDAEVGPWRLEAEDFTHRNKDTATDGSASGGKCVRSGQYLRLSHLPFPRTSRPVTVYLRVKSGAGEEEYRLLTTQGGRTQFLSTVKPAKPRAWQWVHFPPAHSGEAGDSFGVDFRQAKGAVEPVALDAVVLSTRDDLGEAALDGVPSLFGRQPLAVVSRTATPPGIDGVPDDACWRRTIACTGFLGVRSLAPAQGATSARLCYDDTNLYALFVCREPILGVAQQRRHEFAAKITERDARVYHDDSVLLLLDPSDTGKQVFDFILNSIGTIVDAQCPGPDLWETRDVTWDSSVQAAGTTGDGVWHVEVAIPFADLAGRPPKPGDTWQACLGRIAKARKESSSWNLSNRGFHDPHSLGALVFAGPTLGATLDVPTSLQPGRNKLSASVTPADDEPAGLYLMSSLGTPSGTSHSYQFAGVAGEAAEVTGSFEIREEAELRIAHGLLDAATLQPLCLTPVVTRAVRSTVATATLTCDGPYELFLNGEPLGRGQEANAAQLAAPLQRGVNVFTLKLQNGTAAVQITAPGLEPGTTNWKISAADTEDATSPTLDDSGWQTAAKVGNHAQAGTIIGKRGEPVVLRHTLLWEKTRTWPTPKPALYIARDSSQHVTVIADGLPKRKLLDWTVYLAVPPEFEVLGSSGYYGNVDYQPSFLCTQLGEQTVDGRKMRVARIAANKPVMTGRHYIFSLFNAFVRCRRGQGGAKNEETSFVYWTEANDRTIVEPRQVIPVRLLPPLNGRQPKKLVWQLWGSFFGNMNNHAMREATLETARAAGVNDICAGDVWSSENAPKYGIKHTVGINFQTWSLNMKPYLSEHPDERLVDADGEPDDSHLCMTLLLGDSWHAVEAKVREKIETKRPHTLDYDYEYGPFNGPHSCYCPKCLAAFREYAKLPSEAELTGAIIREKYEEQWVDFMARRVAQMFRKFKDTIHRLAPGTHFSTYSGYGVPENPKQYGVNWKYVGELQACDHVGCGYGRPVDAIPSTIEALNGIPCLFGVLMRPYDTKLTIPQVPMTKARLLRRSLDSTGGVLLYDRLPMDGRSWYAIAETTRLVASYEEVFLNGKRSVLPGCAEGQVTVLSDGKVTLVCAMNGGSKEVTLSLTLPAQAGAGQEFYGGRKVAAGETVTVTLPAGDSAAFVLR